MLLSHCLSRWAISWQMHLIYFLWIERVRRLFNFLLYDKGLHVFFLEYDWYIAAVLAYLYADLTLLWITILIGSLDLHFGWSSVYENWFIEGFFSLSSYGLKHYLTGKFIWDGCVIIVDVLNNVMFIHVYFLYFVKVFRRFCLFLYH